MSRRADATMPDDGSGEPGRAPYLAVAGILLGAIAVSKVLPWSERAFGSNVPPLFAKLHPSVGPWLPLALGVAVAAWFAVPRLGASRTSVYLAVLVALGWALAVTLAAQAHGLADVTAPFRRPLDYYANVPLVHAMGPRVFAERYPELIGQLSLHARTHPPGAVLLLWVLSTATGGSVTAVSLIVVAIGLAGAVPTYAIAREAYGEGAARGAAALFVFAPGVLLFSATSMDAVFMTVTACALAALVRAPRSDGWAIVAGVLTAVALCFTFGAVSLGLVGAGVGLLALSDRKDRAGERWRLVRRGALVIVGLVAGAVAIRLTIGIDLIAVFRGNLSSHFDDPSRARPYLYWAFADVPAFLITVGFAQTALLAAQTRARWRDRRPGLETVLWGTLVVLSLSGLFLGEVDHIWLFLVPLAAAPAGEALVSLRGDMSGPLAGSIAQATITQVLLSTYW